ncbi:26457_t:CDS:2 [Dentiscutata erythropus]|uniref:26457_t:CDS:1 n=1 Tax=Dentiscutata erythropus TaxID=1348616 RepID=A0A9N8Z0A6_9GLOM|nr:26457_t:CDS:2 [Dentiscutata erythropus]
MSTEVSNLINPTKIIDKKVFPDQSEDVFWQKASDANEETRDNDVIWNPQKHKQPQQEHSSFVITPPPPLPLTNTVSRHSRKSSRISWGLQTDFERHIGLLESKLAEIVSQGNKHVNKSVGFEGTPLSTLGYHPQEDLSPDINFENEDGETHDPQESDEGLWLLWKSSSITSKNNSMPNQWNLPFLAQNRNLNATTSEISNGEHDMHDGDGENDSILDEMLLNNVRKKNDNDYLRMNGGFGGNLLFSYCLPVVTFAHNWWCCGSFGLYDD